MCAVQNIPTGWHLHSPVCRSSGSVMQSLRRYPLTVAFGSLFLVFVLPKVMTFGLVGVERTALAFLLEMEEILVAVLLAGAKWVSRCCCAGIPVWLGQTMHSLKRSLAISSRALSTVALRRWHLLQHALVCLRYCGLRPRKGGPEQAHEHMSTSSFTWQSASETACSVSCDALGKGSPTCMPTACTLLSDAWAGFVKECQPQCRDQLVLLWFPASDSSQLGSLPIVPNLHPT